MDSKFIPVSVGDYPDGYFESVAKGGKSTGGILIGCGAVFSLLGFVISCLAFSILLDVLDGKTYNDMVSAMIFFWVLAVAFFIPAVLCFRFGSKRRKMDAAAWIQKSAQVSDYPESIIRSFASQVVRTDSIRFNLAGSWATGPQGVGILTVDYILFENVLKLCIIKRSDIVGAYLVSLPDSVSVGNKIKTVYRMSIAIFSNHGTYIITETKQETGNHLIAMLTEANPNIDTANGKVISDDEYDKMIKSVLPSRITE